MQSVTMTNIQLPPEFQSLHDELYKKIGAIVSGHVIDLKTDPSMLIVIFESAMTIVERFRNNDGHAYTGAEKKQIALSLIKSVILDLTKNGIIPLATSQEIISSVDLWGGVVINVAVDAGNLVFELGQKIVEDARTMGCGASCKKNCCACCIVS